MNTACVPAQSSVVIFGAGGVGLSMVMGAHLAGASPIIAVDKLPARMQLALRLGATHFLPAVRGIASDIRALAQGRGADFAFDATGIPAVQETCLAAVRPGGTVVLSGLAPVGSATNLPGADITRKEKTVKGSYYGSALPRRDFIRYAGWYREGRLNLDPLLTKSYALSEVRKAYQDLNAGSIVRGVLSPDAD